MRAAVHTEYGPPEVVRIENIARPSAGDGELLVKVHASTVNRTDAATRSATPPIGRLVTGLFKPRATTLGCEFSGVVEALGPGATSFEVGQRIFGYVEGPFGGHAEYLTVPHDGSVAAIPDGISFAQAAAATEGAHYAVMYIRAAKLGPDSSILINGGTGGIGSAAVQLAKVNGASVTAVCPGLHIDLVRGIGADRCIDYLAEDFTADDETYDVVFDAVGKSTFGQCKRLLKPDGRFYSCELGPWAQNVFLPVITRFTGGPRVYFPLPRHNQRMIERFANQLASSEFRPLIDRHYPLDDIVDAYRYVETGEKIGNVIIDVVPEAAEG